MSEKILWGPVIEGPFSCKPEWIDDEEKIDVEWHDSGEWYSYTTPEGARADCIGGWPTVTKIRLRDNRPHYAPPPDSGPTDYEIRLDAIGIANGDINRARAIYDFLKGDK